LAESVAQRRAPAPGIEPVTEREPCREDHEHRQEQARSRRRLYAARVAAALAEWSVLGYIDDSTTVLAAECKALREPQEDQHDRRSDPDRLIGEQTTDEEGCRTHDDDLHEERALAAHQVAEPPTDHRSRRPDQRSLLRTLAARRGSLSSHRRRKRTVWR
jgi:hypothetical protein